MDNKEIRQIRIDKGLTQKQMAQLLMCNIETVRRYEWGWNKPRQIYADLLTRIKSGELDAQIEALKNAVEISQAV